MSLPFHTIIQIMVVASVRSSLVCRGAELRGSPHPESRAGNILIAFQGIRPDAIGINMGRLLLQRCGYWSRCNLHRYGTPLIAAPCVLVPMQSASIRGAIYSSTLGSGPEAICIIT